MAQLYDQMIQGGYVFETSNADNAKRSLRISLTKNPAFHKLPNGSYGLKEWYPNAKSPAPKARKGSEEGDDDPSLLDDVSQEDADLDVVRKLPPKNKRGNFPRAPFDEDFEGDPSERDGQET